MKSRVKYKNLVDNEAAMDEAEWSLPVAWRNGELSPDGVSRCHHRLLPDVRELENDLESVEKSVRDYLDTVNNQCRAGSALSSTFSKLLRGTTLSKISQQYQHVTEQLEHSAHESSVAITNCVMAILCDFTSTLPGIKREIDKYRQCKDHFEKRREALESFAEKDASASEGKRFQLAKERFYTADKDCTRQQEQLSQCLSSLEENRIKMLGASLLSLLHTVAQFSGTSSLMLAPLGEYQAVGDYLRDREIGAHLKEATATWCSIAQGHQAVRDSEYLSAGQIYDILEHRKGKLLDSSTKEDLAKHLKTIFENYEKEVTEIDAGAVIVPGGFNKNPDGIALALKGCCSQLETLAPSGVREPRTYEEMITLLKEEIPKVQLSVGSVGKPWCKVSNLRDSDELQSRQHYIQDLIEPLAKQFDIPFTKESLKSFTLTVLNEGCSKKTVLASKIAVQLMYGKADLVEVTLNPESSKLRQVRVNCKETNVSIEVQLTWWITADQTLFSGLLDDDAGEPIFQVNTTYCTVIDYMDYLEEKETVLPSITVELRPLNATEVHVEEHEGTSQTVCSDSCPVPPPRTKHYARKIQERRQKTVMHGGFTPSVDSTDDKKSSESSGKDKTKDWFSLSAKLPSMGPAACTGATSHLSLASESELSEVINFLSGFRGVPDANDGDTESVCSIRAMSDSGIESVKNAKLESRISNSGGGDTLTADGQVKGKRGKKKEKKAAAKANGENVAKKKKKKRNDKSKKEKKKAVSGGGVDEKAVSADGEDKKEAVTEGTNAAENSGKQGEESSQNRTLTRDQVGGVQQDSDAQRTIKPCESLRSVWEPIEKNGFQSDTPLLTNLNKKSAMSASQDSVYHSCWSLAGLGADTDDTSSVQLPPEPKLGSEFNIGGSSWSKGYGSETKPTTSIWSNPLSTTFDNRPRKELWPPSLTRQDGVDVEEKDPIPVAGESVFSLGLGITGLELFAAAKQAGLPSDSRNRRNDERKDRQSSFSDNRSTTSPSFMWPHEKPTAGQFTEKSSSCGEGLHRHYPARLHTHHSDPFLNKNVPWNPSVPPMYMKVRYNPNIVPTIPVDDSVSRPYATSVPPRTYFRPNHPNPGNYPLPPTDPRRNMSKFYGLP